MLFSESRSKITDPREKFLRLSVRTLHGWASGQWIGTIVESQLSQGLMELRAMGGMGEKKFTENDENRYCEFISNDYAVRVESAQATYILFEGLAKCDF